MTSPATGAGVPAVAAALLIGAAPAPQAQALYRCERDGRVQYSDRACDTDSRSDTRAVPGRTGPANRPAHWRLMTADCRFKAEQLQRLSAAAGQDEGANEQLAAERELYEARCSDDESQARQRLLDSARDEQERRQLQSEQRQQAVELCAEMRRIVDLRRPRAAQLPVGERADFERFEANFRQRCQNLLPR